MTDMRCPECEIQGHRSAVTSGPIMSTAVYCPPFFDEGGKEHHHDRNVMTAKCRCSRGHEFTQRTGHRCWCGWTIRGMLATDGDRYAT